MACDAASLSIRGERMGGGTGTVQADLYVENVGRSVCGLSESPHGIAIVRTDGIVLPIAVRQVDPVELGPPVTLEPGVADAANVAFNWSNWCGATLGPLRVQLTLPDGSKVTGPLAMVGYSVPRCDDPTASSAIEQLWGFASPSP